MCTGFWKRTILIRKVDAPDQVVDISSMFEGNRGHTWYPHQYFQIRLLPASSDVETTDAGCVATREPTVITGTLRSDD